MSNKFKKNFSGGLHYLCLVKVSAFKFSYDMSVTHYDESAACSEHLFYFG